MSDITSYPSRMLMKVNRRRLQHCRGKCERTSHACLRERSDSASIMFLPHPVDCPVKRLSPSKFQRTVRDLHASGNPRESVRAASARFESEVTERPRAGARKGTSGPAPRTLCVTESRTSNCLCTSLDTPCWCREPTEPGLQHALGLQSLVT